MFDTTKRGFFNVDYNHTFNAAGTHQLKGGAGFQRSTQQRRERRIPAATSTSTGTPILTGAQGQRDTGTYGYYGVDDLHPRQGRRRTSSRCTSRTPGRSTPRLTLNLGLRTENEKMPSFRPDIKENAFEFGFADKLAPRLGATFDVRGDGRVKVSGSWGRYFDWTKY